MKLIKSNGRTCTVREVGPVIMTLRATNIPIPIFDEIVEDDVARERVRYLLSLKVYQRES